MEFIKKHKGKLQILLIVVLLGCALGIGTPIVVKNIKEAQVQAIKLESKANAKEAWEEVKDSLKENEMYYWNDGTYYWVIDYQGNIIEENK